MYVWGWDLVVRSSCAVIWLSVWGDHCNVDSRSKFLPDGTAYLQQPCVGTVDRCPTWGSNIFTCLQPIFFNHCLVLPRVLHGITERATCTQDCYNYYVILMYVLGWDSVGRSSHRNFVLYSHMSKRVRWPVSRTWRQKVFTRLEYIPPTVRFGYNGQVSHLSIYILSTVEHVF